MITDIISMKSNNLVNSLSIFSELEIHKIFGHKYAKKDDCEDEENINKPAENGRFVFKSFIYPTVVTEVSGNDQKDS